LAQQASSQVEVEGQQGETTLTTRSAPYNRTAIHAELILSKHDVRILMMLDTLTPLGDSASKNWRIQSDYHA
jgi:hypothetical protein